MTSFLRGLLATNGDPLDLALRLVLGLVILPHGAQKVLGWFGGYGLSGTMGFFTGTLGIPAVFAALAIAAEFLGGIALVLGAGTRVAALAVGVTMLVAALMVHLPNGFFMNWSGAQKGEGFEYHLLAVAVAAALVVRGGGALSVDRLLFR